jgi:hypothetical protein
MITDSGERAGPVMAALVSQLSPHSLEGGRGKL